MRCEDYPCCGHTPADPCEPQWYDEDGAFDLTRNPHAFCDHEEGFCDAEYDEPDECEYCGSEDHRSDRCPDVPEDDYDVAEDQWLDGSYEE